MGKAAIIAARTSQCSNAGRSYRPWFGVGSVKAYQCEHKQHIDTVRFDPAKLSKPSCLVRCPEYWVKLSDGTEGCSRLHVKFNKPLPE
jgi:hypothetical protein